MKGLPQAISLCQRAGRALPGLMTLKILLTWAAGNEDIHFYLMEIPEDLQMGKNILPRKSDGQQPSGHPPGSQRHPL